MKNVIDNGDGQDDSRDPVVRDPGKPYAQFRKESCQEQREHCDRHDQVEESRAERVSGDALWNLGGDTSSNRWRVRMRVRCFREVSYINGVNDQEKQTPNCGNPQKAPSNVDRDLLTPRILRPLDE